MTRIAWVIGLLAAMGLCVGEAKAVVTETKTTRTESVTSLPATQTTIVQKEQFLQRPAQAGLLMEQKEVTSQSASEMKFESGQPMIVEKVKTSRALREPVVLERIATIEPGDNARMVEEVRTVYPAAYSSHPSAVVEKVKTTRTIKEPMLMSD